MMLKKSRLWYRRLFPGDHQQRVCLRMQMQRISKINCQRQLIEIAHLENGGALVVGL